MQNEKRVLEDTSRLGTEKCSCCRDCHFLMKWDRTHNGLELKMETAQDERLRLAQGKDLNSVIGDNYSIACFQNVWDWANRRKDSDDNLQRVLTRDRGETCFFYPHTPGMFFPAAAELERREADRREAKRDRKLTKWEIVIGLFCAVLGAALTKILG